MFVNDDGKPIHPELPQEPPSLTEALQINALQYVALPKYHREGLSDLFDFAPSEVGTRRREILPDLNFPPLSCQEVRR